MKRFSTHPVSMLLAMSLPLVLAACGGGARNDDEPLSSGTFEKALVMLQTDAHSGDAPARAQSIEALQISRDPRALETIEEGLHDRDWVVRFSAAMAAGERKAAGIRPVLNTMVTTDPKPSVRAACVYALTRLGDDSHLNDLLKTFASADPQDRANTALVLGRIGEKSAIELLQHYQNDPDVRVRFEIAAAMARLGDPAAIKVIVSECRNQFAEDQNNAMQVCGDLPPEAGSSPLLLGLQDAPEKLPEGVDPGTVNFLTTQRQLVAARSLAKMKYNSVRAAEIAINNCGNPDARLRALAVLALGDMLSSKDAPKLDPLLVDQDENVRRAAAAAVVNIYTRAAIKHDRGA